VQAKSIVSLFIGYSADVKRTTTKRSDFGERVRAAREAAGLSQRDVAAQLGISQPSYTLWEKNHVALRPDQLLKLASILNVRIEELLDPPRSGRRGGPVGKLRIIFEKASTLPRDQQQHILKILEPYVAQHAGGHSKGD
jgi:transcriptional regulator with XRE-family HTH domain